MSKVFAEGKKYGFEIMAGDYRVTITRHGEPWLVLEQGCGAVQALMYEVERWAPVIEVCEEINREFAGPQTGIGIRLMPLMERLNAAFVAAKHAGLYLVRPVNAGYKRKRRFTDDLEQATMWSAVGHAKNAIREVFANQPTLVSRKATFEIVLVKLAEGPLAARVRCQGDRYGTFRTQDVV